MRNNLIQIHTGGIVAGTSTPNGLALYTPVPTPTYPIVDTLASNNCNNSLDFFGPALELYKFNNTDYVLSSPPQGEYEFLIRGRRHDVPRDNAPQLYYISNVDLVSNQTDTSATHNYQSSIEYNTEISGLQLYKFNEAATVTSADLASNLNGQFDIILRNTSEGSKVAYTTLYDFTGYLQNKLPFDVLSGEINDIALGAAKIDDDIATVNASLSALKHKTDEEDGDFWIRGANSDKNYGMGIGDSSKNLCIKTDTLAGTNYQLINDWDVTGELNAKKTLTVGNSNDLIANPDLSDVELGAATTRFNGNVVRFETNSTVRFDSSTIYFENPPLFKTGLKEGVNELLYTSQNITLPSVDSNQADSNINLLTQDGSGDVINDYLRAIISKLNDIDRRLTALENNNQ